MTDKIWTIRGQKIHVKSCGSDSLPIVVFLHGFTGSTETWREIFTELKGKYRMLAVDLTGHGKSSIPKETSRYSMEEQLADLEALFIAMKLGHFTLVGYSMGGRIALGYTIRYPKRVKTLILESASPGLKVDEERKVRQLADQKLSEKIIADGLSSFVEYWEEISLFSSQKKLTVEKQNGIRKERLNQEALGLSNSLCGIGTGSQPSYWNELSSIHMPVLLITGEIDTKFVDIAREMTKNLTSVNLKTIKNVGHAIHVENPTFFATIVDEHIIKIIKSRG